MLLVTTVYSVCFCQSLQSMTVFLSGSPEEVKRQQLLHRCLSLQSMTVVLSGSPEEVKRQQESLQRCQSLEETQRLFDRGQHQQVVDSLTATFASMPSTHRGVKVMRLGFMWLLCCFNNSTFESLTGSWQPVLCHRQRIMDLKAFSLNERK